MYKELLHSFRVGVDEVYGHINKDPGYKALSKEELDYFDKLVSDIFMFLWDFDLIDKDGHMNEDSYYDIIWALRKDTDT